MSVAARGAGEKTGGLEVRLVTTDEMRAIDSRAIDGLGIPGLTLMESAGMGTVQFIESELGDPGGARIVIICGKGNNGGDGFVIARGLRDLGAEVGVYLLGKPGELTGDARTNYERLEPGSVSELLDEGGLPDSLGEMVESELIIDAIFGTGFEGAPRGLHKDVIAAINASGRPVLAVDVPSGLNASTGAREGECVIASWTCTMALPKRGFYLHPGREAAGIVHVVDIGITEDVITAIQPKRSVLTEEEASHLLPKRDPGGHKGTFGRIAVIAGSVGYTGAAALTSLAALRSGAGLVTLGIPGSLNDILEAKLTEVITRPLMETAERSLSVAALPGVKSLLESADAMALGPGLSQNGETQELIRAIVGDLSLPCVIDADGLNALTPEDIGARHGDAPVVITPHPGEMARLCGRTMADVLEKREEVAADVATRARATVILKGAASVVAGASGEIYLNPTGNDGMASGGTGDVLTGIVAALLGRGMPALDAGVLGAYIHGRAGDIAACAVGRMALIAGDLIDLLPDVYSELESGVCEGQR